MSVLSNIRIEQDPKYQHVHRIYANNNELHYVRAIDTHIEMNEIPTVTVEFVAGTSFDELAQLECALHPESVLECVKGIQFEMQMEPDFKEAVKQSILSAIRDNDWESHESLADAIMDRVFFGER